ncbi:MAG: transposase, partial [Candidatus Hydrothermarchaeales archaeon]
DNLHNQIPYPFFDSACIRYEALRSVMVEGSSIQTVIEKYGLTEYTYRKSFSAFQNYGTPGLIGINSQQLTEQLSVEVERMAFVLKKARAWIPATKMVLILKGFHYDVSLSVMRHLYASYGWALGTKPYQHVDFFSLNLKVIQLCKLHSQPLARKSFFDKEDRLQGLLEVFRTMGSRGITKRYAGSRVSFEQHKKNFLSLGLLGLVDRARSAFRNSKLGFTEEGRIILSKIQKPERNEAYYLKILTSKNIQVAPTCITNIFTRWNVSQFQSQFKGDLERLLEPEKEEESYELPIKDLPAARSIRLDLGFISFVKDLAQQPTPLANPGIFLFLPYLNRLKIFEKASSLMDIDPAKGYSWFSLLLLNLGRILGGICSVSKACRTNELSIPLMAGLVAMPSKDSFLNKLAIIDDEQLLQLRRYLTQAAKQHRLIEGKRIAFDFKMRDFTGDDVELKNIGKGPSPKRKICFPGFRPHLAWDMDTGAPISLEFRNGKARASTTVKRFIRELLQKSLGNQAVEHVYLDSEYTAEHVWKFVVDPQKGLGADLTMCIKQNKKVKKFIDSFLQTNPTWLFYDEDHTYSDKTFHIPITQTEKILQCVLKRKESNGNLRCFGSTLKGLDNMGILQEYRTRWIIEIGIKDLIQNYFFNNIPGIDPHRINIHYFVVTLARTLYEMFCQDYEEYRNHDGSKKTIDTLRPEFITGSNAILSREKDQLFLTWKDYYPEKQHQVLEALFDKLNQESQKGLPFLGGLKLRFEIVPARSKDLYNQFKRGAFEF